MKLKKRAAALSLAAVMALSFTACSPKQALEDFVVNTVHSLGFGNAETDEDTTQHLEAAAGGSITFPEGMDTSSRWTVQLDGDQLYISFKGIQNRSSSYFVAAGSSVTLTAYATTDSSSNFTFKTALWELADDESSTTYVEGSTVYYTADGSCYSQTVDGLTPGKRYKVYVSYDSSASYLTGGVLVSGVGGEDLTDIGNTEA